MLSICLIAPVIVLIVLVCLKKRDNVAVIALAVVTLLQVGVLGSSSSSNIVWHIMLKITEISIILGYAFLTCLAAANFTEALKKYQKPLSKLWFLPATVVIGLVVVVSIVKFDGFHMINAVLGIPMVFIGLWIANPMPEKSAIQTENSAESNEAYCDLGKHILLLLLTFGVWHFMWIYRMTCYTNSVDGEEQRNPTNQLLLCLFVPFYLIYWTYKTAQRVDKMAANKGVSSGLAMLCLILEIFVPIVPPIMLQNTMNAIVTAKNSPAAVIPAKKEETTATLGAADELMKYKNLLDSGVITQEEFDAKKKQLLGL